MRCVAATLWGLLFALGTYGAQQSANSASPALPSGLQSQDSPSAGAGDAQALASASGLYRAGKIKDAENAFQQIVQNAAARKDNLSEAHAHLGLGEIAVRQARFAAVRMEYERALALFEPLNNRWGAARAREGLGDAANGFVDNKSAQDLYRQALSEFEALGLEKDKSRVLMKLAPVTDSYTERIKLDNQALEIGRKLGDRRIQGEALHWRGSWLFHEGDSEAAEQDYKQAETLLDSLEDRNLLGRVFFSEGRLQRVHGALDQSIDTFSRSLKLAEATEDVQAQIAALNAMAASYGDLKKTREALAMFQQAFELARETGSPRTIETLRQNIAEAYINLGEEKRAIEMLEEVNRQNPDPFPYQAQFRYATLALGYWRLHEYDRSLAAAAKSVEEARARKNEQFLSEPLMLKAQTEEKLGQNAVALADARDALKVIEGLRARLVPSDFLKRGFAERRQQVFDFSVELLETMNQPAQAIEVAEEARSRAFLDLLASHQLALHQGVEQSLVVTNHEPSQLKSEGTASPPSMTDSKVAETLIERGASKPAARVGVSSEPELPSAASTASASLREMEEQAGRLHSTILSYWVSDEASFVWVVRPGEVVHSARIPVKREQLAQLVNSVWPTNGNASRGDKTGPAEPELHEAGINRGGEVEFPSRGQTELKASPGQKDRWRDLYRLLIEPIETYLPAQDGSRITIIPHGPLFALPFAGLRDAHGRYLVERYTLEYSPAISVLKFTGAMHTPADPSAFHFLLIGDPAGMQKLGLPQLAGSRKEVSAVAHQLSPDKVTVLQGEDARLEAVRSAAPNNTVIHFATHGILDDQQPFDSFLALSDGKLSVRDVYGLNLAADLVFLSACRSGMGKVNGDGVLGLTRAFLYAGSRSVVATLWDVADEPTARLVADFYRNVRQGQDKAQALRKAQLSILAQLRAKKIKIATSGAPLTLPENPVFWASFVLIGEP